MPFVNSGDSDRVMRHRIIQFLLAFAFTTLPCLGQAGYVAVLVSDTQGRPVKGIQIGIEGGDSKLTGDDGKVQLALAAGTKPGSWITYHVLHSAPGKDFVINSPWDRRDQVPVAGNPESPEREPRKEGFGQQRIETCKVRDPAHLNCISKEIFEVLDDFTFRRRRHAHPAQGGKGASRFKN